MNTRATSLRWTTAIGAALVGASSAMAQLCAPVQILASGGSAEDFFGSAVSISGDTLVVGSPIDDVGSNADQGSAHVFHWTGSAWAYETTLTAADGAPGDQFGGGVALSGDTLVVIASQDDVGSHSNQGSAYVFVRSGGTWTQQTHLIPSDGAAGDQTASVAISGNTILLGAYWHDVGGNPDQGAAYVFVRSGTSWSQQARLTASDGAAGDHFGGRDISLSGDTALIGAYFDYNAGSFGSAYVFVRSGSTWTQQAKLTVPGGSQFGYAVSIAGDTAVVGSPFQDGARGAAYIYSREGSAWMLQREFVPADARYGEYFAYSLATDGQRILAGSGAHGTGSAYLLNRSGSNWTQQEKLTAPDAAGEVDSFGVSVALFEDTLLIGARRDTVGGNFQQGSAWVFPAGAQLFISTQPAAQTTCPGGSASFSITAAGTSPFTYQWRLNNAPIDPIANPSAATDTLLLTDVQTGDDGFYDCVVTNECGSVTSDAAKLSICHADWNCANAVDSQDFYDFLEAFFAGDADFNGVGGTDSQDYIDFLEAFFSGC